MKKDNELSPDAIRSAVDRILASSDFKASARNGRFLKYIVKETLSGRTDQFKAVEIAMEVFGRRADFDPQTDPIVRVEARRLRRALEQYYLTAGADDPLRISIPKGAYVPLFKLARLTPHPSVTVSSNIVPVSAHGLSQPPSVFVVPFVLEGETDRYPDFGQGLTRQIIVALTRFCDLFVYGSETSFVHGAPTTTEGAGAELDSDFRLSGGVTLGTEHFAVEAMLSETNTGHVLWADRFETALNPSNVLEWREQVAEEVARIIAQPYGVIFSRRAQEVEGKHAGDLSSYECVNRYYQYSRTYNRTGNAGVIECLEKTIAREPHYAEAFACLSQAYSDAYRFGFPCGRRTDDPLGRAKALALKSIELAPRSSLSFHALGTAYWFQNDVGAAIEALETGLELNPNATALMAELGLRTVTLGNWERGVPLLEESYARNPAQPGHHRIGLALFHFAEGRFQKALLEVQKIEAPDVLHIHLVEAIALIRVGRKDDAKAAVGRILDIRPDYGLVVRDDLALRNVEPKLAAKIVDALQDAGLPVR